MFTIDDLANGKCAVINDGTLDELKAVLKKAFPQDFNTFGTYKYYFATMTKTRWNCGDKTSLPTQSVKQFLNMEEKKIIGYKLNGKVNRETVNRFLGESVPMCGDILLSGKTKHINEMTSEEKSVYFTKGHVAGSLVKKCKDAGVLDIWFEPIYEPEKPKEEIISMGSFDLKVTKEGIFHKSENIKEFVKYISSVRHNSNFGFHSKAGGYDLIVKDIVLSKTGCENTETTVSQWLKVWDKYQEFQIKLCQHY